MLCAFLCKERKPSTHLHSRIGRPVEMNKNHLEQRCHQNPEAPWIYGPRGGVQSAEQTPQNPCFSRMLHGDHCNNLHECRGGRKEVATAEAPLRSCPALLRGGSQGVIHTPKRMETHVPLSPMELYSLALADSHNSAFGARHLPTFGGVRAQSPQPPGK